MRNLLIFVLLFLLGLTCSGCGNGSITPLGLSDIQGPARVSERTTNKYSVQASGDQNPTFQWTLGPGTVCGTGPRFPGAG